ncbi:MAG: Verru Chthon cassette protein [Phycisphaerales bacterium]|nr:Verru Chthon cassette protein [Phycisphaerales bacterium]
MILERRQPRPFRRPRTGRGFTLVEMLVVLGIVILFVTLAIPAISAITGTRSISAAENQISAVLARAREEAIGIQDFRGVFFYLDPREDRVVAALVRPADLQNKPGLLLLDLVENRDYLMMPQGIRVQTLLDSSVLPGAPASPLKDRYLGFNPPPSSADNTLYGGVILFDGQGRLVSKNYAFQMQLPDPQNPGNPGPGMTDMAVMFKTSFAGTFPNYGPSNANLAPLRSQMGLVLFDNAAFKAQGFTDGDPILDKINASATTEVNEETWLDTNSTPILINRFNGTLIRGE